ncbi:nicotinate-nucleotide diphosphorylase (carboxylating), partial [Candidatus Bathyarchaeota archaeon]|nr:nicotinate-nucleotide diphosphorylase (carboxylating) [Candidatus Bathyarchaeota archaeon]
MYGCVELEPLEYHIIEKIKAFLNEDIGYGDITSETLIPPEQMAKGRLYFKEPGIVSGLVEVATVFKILNCSVEYHKKDSERTEAGETLLTVRGPARALLRGERLALNIIG